ncbi:hypothetical protein KJ781_03465 [Patescibacteria group bacterium]|nr:hypothetical protein [Patescibacteria group bacterium]MBU1448684.1 hypothetical protein [Patescibacteria group bacterium]MBU2613345.1 hypothetical protein [Patescibacteria group bacterium]
MVRAVRIFFGICVALCLVAGSVSHAMTSTNYSVLWDSINSGGNDSSTSTNFLLRDTVGEQAVGLSTSTNYSIRAGYRQGDTDMTIASFSIGTQVNSSETTFTAFSQVGKTVTVASQAQFSTGTFIGVVENKGLTQLVAIGKILSMAGNVLTVDGWEGVPGSLSATPSGGDDFVYRIDGYAAEFGVLTSSIGVTSLTHTSVSTNLENGYTVSVQSDGDLRYGVGASIANVSDGSVSLGSEEYGARVYGTMATSTGSDLAFSTTTRPVQESTTFADDERIGLIYKVTITSDTPAGDYAQSVYYTFTPNL